jgi:hypothetical protein
VGAALLLLFVGCCGSLDNALCRSAQVGAAPLLLFVGCCGSPQNVPSWKGLSHSNTLLLQT